MPIQQGSWTELIRVCEVYDIVFCLVLSHMTITCLHEQTRTHIFLFCLSCMMKVIRYRSGLGEFYCPVTMIRSITARLTATGRDSRSMRIAGAGELP
jgi:hypothetical protein